VTWSARVWLVRHGEVTSYLGDHGLTDRGAAQAREAAAALAPALGTDAEVDLRHATSARASGTAEVLGAALRGAGVRLSAPNPDPGFDNFRVDLGGQVRPHDAMRLALAGAPDGDGPPPTWRAEGTRFARIHDGGGDPITWWLTQPTLAYEPAAHVVRRFWRALGDVAAAGTAETVVCTHSGPMRALAAQALGRDPGEPEHLEHVEVRMSGAHAGAAAQLSYRGHTVPLALPRLEEPAWS
jgi:broad specificity phosphatase PhoE